MSVKEYIAVGIIIFFLIILSETKIKMGANKFGQLSCAARLKKIYQAMDESLKTDSGCFTKNPLEPWYKSLSGIEPELLLCPSSEQKQHASNGFYCDYAINNSVFDQIKQEKRLKLKSNRKILLLDSQSDPTNLNIFPMSNPDFRHNGGCNILLIDGTVLWCDKEDFTGGEK